MIRVCICIIAVSACTSAEAQEKKDLCSDVLKFGKRIVVKKERWLTLLYNEKIGLEKRISEAGGNGTIVLPDGIPVKGSFNWLVNKAKYEQAKNLALEQYDSYVFVNELPPEVTKAWLECMKLRATENDKPYMFFKEETKQLVIRYGNDNSIPIKILSYQLTNGLKLKGTIPKSFRKEVKISLDRNDKTQAEGIKIEFETGRTKGTHTLDIVWPPVIPNFIHFEEEKSVSVPTERSKKIDWEIPKIPDGATATVHAIYAGGSPADNARVNLVCGVHIKDEQKKELASFSWKQGAPQTHIKPDRKFKSLEAGKKYSVTGDTVVERNQHYRGGSTVKLLVVLKLEPKKFEISWRDKVVRYAKPSK